MEYLKGGFLDLTSLKLPRIGPNGQILRYNQELCLKTKLSESMNTTTDDKTIVKDYFNATGFDRWRRIYGDGDVNKVQKDIRLGHQQTIDTVVDWLKTDGNLSTLSICDAGCGVGVRFVSN